MSYRIVRITDLFKEYLVQYQSAFPHIKEGTYEEQYIHLSNNSFDTATSISKNLKRLGIDAHAIYTNAEWLQDRWKIEHNCDKTGKELVFEQLKVLKPEVIWIDNSTLADPQWVSMVRTSIPSVKIITGLVCAPYSSKEVKTLQTYNFITTCTPCLQRDFLDLGIESHQIYHGFDTDLLPLTSEQNSYPDIDLLFIGSLYTGGGFHKTRIEYLEEFLASDIPMKILAGIDKSSKILSKKIAYHTINLFRKVGAKSMISHIPVLNQYESYGDTPVKFYSEKLKSSISSSVYGLEQFKQLAKAKICFNIHGEIAKGCAGNLRLFEATGVGACLVTDWKKNLHELFEPDKEVVTYNSKEECKEKILWLLKNPEERQRIATAGHLRTLKDHNLLNRAGQIDRLIRSKL